MVNFSLSTWLKLIPRSKTWSSRRKARKAVISRIEGLEDRALLTANLPIAVADVYNATEDTTLNGVTVLGNDTDLDADVIDQAILDTTTTNGALTLNLNGTFTYVPNANFSGLDSFTYFARDSLNGENSATSALVTINVASVDDLPVAATDTLTVAEDSVLNSGDLSTNDTPSGDGGNIWTLTTPATNGVAVVNPDGTYTYTPTANYNGMDSFTYTITDIDGDTSIATVAITVTSVDDVPVATNDTLLVLEDSGTANGDLALNDTPSADGGNVWTLTTPATGGVAVVNAAGTYTYTPNANFNGSDSFSYTITDIDGSTSTAIVAITVTAVNDVPLAVTDTLVVAEDSGATGGNLATNDIPSGDGGNVWSLTTPALNGTAVVNTDGTFSYTPNANYNGADSFSYTLTDVDGDTSIALVSIIVTLVDDVPIAANDTLTVAEDSVLNSGDLSTNDTPSGDGGNIWTLLTPATNGVAIVNPDGTFTYTPTANYNGPDSFFYTITDIDGDSNIATVAITVTSVNDVPVATNDTLLVLEDSGTANGDLALNDTPSADGGNVWTLTTPATGGVAVVNAVGTYTYTPNANFNGSDSFTYTITDIDGSTSTAVVAITVTAIDDVPVAVADTLVVAEDSGATSGNLATNDIPSGDGGNVWTLSTAAVNGVAVVNPNGTFTYTPNANYNGADSFSYTITDVDGDTSIALVSIIITLVDDVPVAANDTLTVAEDSGVTVGNLALNDTPSGDGGNVWTLTTGATNGVAVVGPAGTYTYTPNANYNGSDSFTYTITDVDGDTSTATVAVTVTALNDAPVVVNGSGQVAQDGTFNGSLAPLGTDIDGNPLTYSVVTQPLHGTLNLSPDGNFVYSPAAGFSGADLFTFQANDGQANSNVAVYNLNVLDLFTLVLSPVPGTIATTRRDAVPLDNNAQLINVDPSVNFANASIQVSIVAGADRRDRVFITDGAGGSGTIDARGRRIFFNGNLVARTTGGRRGVDLQISFNSSATLDTVNAVLQRISVKTSKHASRATRTIQMTVSASGETSTAMIDANVA